MMTLSCSPIPDRTLWSDLNSPSVSMFFFLLSTQQESQVFTEMNVTFEGGFYSHNIFLKEEKMASISYSKNNH